MQVYKQMNLCCFRVIWRTHLATRNSKTLPLDIMEKPCMAEIYSNHIQKKVVQKIVCDILGRLQVIFIRISNMLSIIVKNVNESIFKLNPSCVKHKLIVRFAM